MKKILYVDSKGLEQVKLNVSFIATEKPFMTYRHPILVNEEGLKLGESVTKDVVVYHVGKKEKVIVLKDENLMRVKDLSRVMSSSTNLNIKILGDDKDNKGSLGFFSRTIEGEMVILNMTFNNDTLYLDVYNVSLGETA